ncbi:hypothetical protein [Gluconobacter japonicus]|uniref:hypothetical protein n=1 Tax=Gluconobacter japonicus TaxID=376620 RepID=UPI0039E98C34
MSALPAGLRDTGWFTRKIEGDNQQIVNAVEQICSKLGTVAHGRGGVELETVAPSPPELAHPRSPAATNWMLPGSTISIPISRSGKWNMNRTMETTDRAEGRPLSYLHLL